MRFYEHLVREYWIHHPGGKARLAIQATGMLWSPTVRKEQPGVDSSSGGLSSYRKLAEALWAVPVFLLAALGLVFAGRSFRRLALIFIGYETAAAWVFAGTTRYRVAWDFVLALLAAVALERLWSRWSPSRSR
jgi:hypothetical protein